MEIKVSVLTKFITLTSLGLIASVQDMANGNATAGQHLYLAETEVHSTAGIANRVHRRYEQFDDNETPPDESSPNFEEEVTREELEPPTTVEKISSTRSKVVTRTTSRPSKNNRRGDGVDIAPVLVPVYPGGQNYPPPPPAMRR